MSPSSLDVDVEDDELPTVIGLYALGEMTLSEAAERLGVSKTEMQEILHESGVSLRLGPRTRDEATEELDTVRRANE